jgi:CRP-like cAMP-binding protein
VTVENARDEPWCADCPMYDQTFSDAFGPGELALLQVRPAAPRSAPPGTLLIHEGDPASSVFVLAAGWAARARLMPDGRELVFQLHLPGDIIGYGPALLGLPSNFSVRALTPISYHVVDRACLATLSTTAPALAQKLMLRVCRRQRIFEHWFLHVGGRQVEERLAWFLLDLFVRLRLLRLVQGNTFRLPLSQQQIANAIGATVVHVNRVLRRLREAGLATVRNREVCLDDPVGLRRIACLCGAPTE